tara:strand:- start:286 stop:576 length:291 start_codon:yes stop_codon:yes gene_type:complete
VQSSASLFGPAVTVAKTGSIYQAGFSYASNNVLADQLGKDPFEYIKDVITQNSNINEPITLVTLDENLNDSKLSLKSENTENDYNNFLMAVKKILK